MPIQTNEMGLQAKGVKRADFSIAGIQLTTAIACEDQRTCVWREHIPIVIKLDV